jgi:hypothetical protein
METLFSEASVRSLPAEPAPLAALPRSVAEVVPSPYMMAVGGPVYQPPYETPLEDEMAWHLVKYLARLVNLESQVRVVTPCGPFWVDFVLERQGRRIALEISPLEDQEDPQQQRFRDALVVGSGQFDVLYRLRGHDVFHRLEDVLYLLAKAHPQYFTDRAQVNLERLASDEARKAALPERGMTVSVTYRTASTDPSRQPLQITRLRLKCATDWVRDHDRALADYGSTVPLALSA